jgi:hypothetical protein
MCLYPSRRETRLPGMTDDGGVIGRLPRSRPGHRSAKRAEKPGSEGAEPAGGGTTRAKRSATAKPSGGAAGRATGSGTAKTTARAATRAERSGAKAARPTSAARPASGAAARGGARRPAGPTAAEARRAQRAGRVDPVADAVRTVTGLAATSARVANGVAREVLRRLPRP